MDDPIWISIELTLAIHARQLSEHGGINGVRDMGLLESALARPRQRFAYGDPTPSIAELSGQYAYGIARNHPFLDGNKRTAYVVCRTFLVLNGYDMTALPAERYTTFLSLAAGDLSEEALLHWLTANTKRG
jgi:death-on-curing protein